MATNPSFQELNTLAALFNARRYPDAAGLAQTLTVRFPLHGFAWKVMGAALMEMGRSADALAPLQKAAALSPGDAEAHYNAGVALQNLGRYPEAETSYRRALAIKPDFDMALSNLGATLKYLGRLEEAETCFRRILARHPDFAETHSNLGVVLGELGRLEEAEACYRLALQLRPDYIEAYNDLGFILKELGRLDEAEACVRRVLALRPDSADAHNNLGNLLKEAGRLDEAEASYRRALRLKPDYADGHYNLGNLLKGMGRLDEALASFRLALDAKDWKAALRHLTSPLLLSTGLVLDSHYPTAAAADAPAAKEPAAPVIPMAAKPEWHLPAALPSEPPRAKKLRVVLIYPPPWQIPSPGEPLRGMPFGPPRDGHDPNLDGDFQTITYGLLTIAAQAKRAGYDVGVYNLSATRWQDVVALITGTEADVYGISAFTANRRGMGAVAALIRQLHPQAHITAGGPFVTALPLDTLRYYRDIDTAVVGEGEETFMALLESLENGHPAVGIPGSVWRNGEALVVGSTRPRIKNLDALASPFDYFTSFIVMTSRGCPSKCTFCGSFTTWGKMLRFHSVESCIDIFKKALARLPVPFLAIKDDTFTAHRRRTIAICDAIIENRMNFIWSCDTRVDSLDDELLRKMRLAGCQMISLGVESGSPEILKTMRKDTTPEMVLEATRSAQKYGMHVRYYMILVNRGETPETIRQSNDLIKAGRPNRYFSGPLSFFPGTEDWAVLREQQGLTPDIFFTNDFMELTVATNRQQALSDVLLYITSDIGAIYGFDYTVEERAAVAGRLPDLHSVHLELANACFRAGRLDEAESALNRAEELGFPIESIVYNQRACIALARNEIGNALGLLTRALQRHPHPLVTKNLKSLQAWADAPLNERGAPPALNDSVQSIEFAAHLK